mmetsp:Transcript_8247/g.10324  ORF Transcript_8247/g.10324 Transcript_8247/m.10324 type:complete len:258 (+) Transcript_8247:50-823(+)|eukprot:CAMPEP_0203672650 /NCGR_PEP_ID=MMETSP0090-20130426/8638_1 /ASSEMBLY_ACC=CAM_ASM_001088 /TAXON_ID=426623 /ORGANISM="Chaetoceros affinis, Strain CCMP159" /LENGTH=257 /DNA_ID=CAMNT_0050537999 /DNA_START=26 /DNA_END=799 /DNA_ORIENTATION=-
MSAAAAVSRKVIFDSLIRQSLCHASLRSQPVRGVALRQYHSLNRPTSIVYNVNDTAFMNKSSNVRAFSDKSSDEGENNDEAKPSENEESTDENSKEEEPTEIEKLEAQVKEMKDQLLRSYAEQENIRRIAQKDVSNAKAFAISSFAKSLLDTSDNLTRALDAVPEEYREDKENHAVLATLFEGIKMTDDGLTKAFEKNGLKKFGVVGDKFDPNKHEALFEYPDNNMEAGTIGQVMKVGFSLKDRVIRPAEVGVIKSS